MNTKAQQDYHNNIFGNGINDNLQIDMIQCDQEQKQQYNCAFCKRMAIKPIILVCNHNLCLTCANFLKEQESDSGIQARYKVSCPACQANTVTYNLKNLLVQQKNEIYDSDSLKIISLQTSPNSKRNIRTASLPRNQQSSNNLSSQKYPTTMNTQESYPQKGGYIKQPQNSSQNYLENRNQTCQTIQYTNGYGQQFQLDKSLENIVSVQRNNSVSTPYSNKKNINASMQSHQSINNISQTSSYKTNSNTVNQNNSLFFTPLTNHYIHSSSSPQKLINDSTPSQNRVYYTIPNHHSSNQLPKNNNQSSTSISQQHHFQEDNQQQQQENVKISSNINTMEQLKCTLHNEQYSLFCSSDKTLLCIECLYCSKLHKNHNIIPLKNAQQLLKKENVEFKIQSENYLKKLEASLQIASQNKQTLNREFTKNAQKINEIFDGMICTVNAKRFKVLEQLEQRYQIQSNVVELQMSECINIKSILEEYKHFDEQILENAYSDSYIFSAFKMIQQALDQTNIDLKPLKIDWNIMEIENSHKLMFNKLVENIVQLQNKKVDSLLMTKCQKLNQQSSLPTSSQQNVTINSSKIKKQQHILAYAPSPYVHSKDPTPKKYSNHSLQNSNSKSNNQNISSSCSSSQSTTQRVLHKKQSSSTNLSEKINKNTQACSKNSYKTLKRKLSTDFNSVSQSKENIQQHSLYQGHVNTFDLKKRSQSIQGDVLYDPIKLLNVQTNKQQQQQQQSYNFGEISNNQPIMTDSSNNNCGNIFLREKYTQQERNYCSNVNDNQSNTTNLSQLRSPFKEYIIN